MPYFICRLPDSKTVEILDKYAKYRDARDEVRDRRRSAPEGDTATYRVIFANNPIEAEKLLLTPREAPVQGDD